MITINDNELDDLLKQLKPSKAPSGLSQKVMQQISQTDTPTVSSTSVISEQLLLGLSILVGMITIVFFIDFQFISEWMLIATSWMKTFLNNDQDFFNRIASTAGNLPAFSLMIVATIALLLITERAISKRFHKINFVL